MKTEVVTNGGLNAEVEFKVNIQLTENEARAWDAIVGYGWESFIEVFEKHLGAHYIKPYKGAAKKMFEETRQTIGFQLHGIEAAKKAISDLNLQGQNIIRETVS